MYWPLLNMYSEILDLGQEVFIIRGTFIKRRKGLILVPCAGRRVQLWQAGPFYGCDFSWATQDLAYPCFCISRGSSASGAGDFL